jgi:transposase-like protein
MATAGHGRQAKQKAVLAALSAGNTRRAAAAAAGISKQTLYVWLQEPTFSDRVAGAESEAEIAWQKSIATAGEKDWRALAWMMERRFGQDWRERKEVNFRDLSTEQLLELVRRGEAGADSAGDTAAVEGRLEQSLPLPE